MSINSPDEAVPDDAVPDYALQDLRIITSTAELKGVFHPLRSTLLDLMLERSATVAELAEAVGRPKSTVAYHVGILLQAGLLRVVRTRRVRAIDERFYGRTARIFYVGTIRPEQVAMVTNYLTVAAAESGPAHEADSLRAILRYARISRPQAAEFWSRVFELVGEFSGQVRTGDQVYGFVAGLYPTERPTLPAPDPDHPAT